MCSRGVYQLTKLSLYFCDYGGSSSGVRSLLLSPKIKQFLVNNPQIQVDFICKRNNHPFVSGTYINGYKKSVPLRSDSEEVVLQKLNQLRNQLGRSSFKASGTRVFGAVKSMQGLWQPNIFNKYPIAELETAKKIPWVNVGTIKKEVVRKDLFKEKDLVSKSMKFGPISNGNFESNKGGQI